MHPYKLRLPTLITAVVALALLAVAIDWNAQPGVALAQDIAVPKGLTATSGDGTMKVSWGSANGATGGYRYRYTDELLYTISGEGNVSEWFDHGSKKGDNSVDISAGTLTVGNTYYFQVRGKDNNTPPEYGGASEWSAGEVQRAAPSQLANVAAAAGNAQVTLSWDNPNDDTIVNYEIRRGGGSGWGKWETTTSYTMSNGTVTDTVGSLTNGTTYSFQVRAKNLGGDGAASETVTATPKGPPAAPDLSVIVGVLKVTLTWADAGDLSINKYQYRYQVAGATAWEQDWADIANPGVEIVQLPTSKEVSELTNGREYTFEVRAVSDASGAGPAAAINATPQSGETAPGVMTGIGHTVTGVTDGSGGMVTFTWTDPDDDSIDKYQYRYDGDSNTPDTWDPDWTDIPVTNNDKDLTTWSVNIHGTTTSVFYELRALNDPTGDEFFPVPPRRSPSNGKTLPPPQPRRRMRHSSPSGPGVLNKSKLVGSTRMRHRIRPLPNNNTARARTAATRGRIGTTLREVPGRTAPMRTEIGGSVTLS